MGRRYLSTLLKAFAEKLLIADDLISERVVLHAAQQKQLGFQNQRLNLLEERLDRIQEQLQSLPSTDGTVTQRAAA